MISELTAILITAPFVLIFSLYYWRRNKKELDLLKEQISSNLPLNYVDITSDGSFVFSNGNKYSFDIIAYRVKAIKLIQNSGVYYIANVRGYQPRRVLKHIPKLV